MMKRQNTRAVSVYSYIAALLLPFRLIHSLSIISLPTFLSYLVFSITFSPRYSEHILVPIVLYWCQQGGTCLKKTFDLCKTTISLTLAIIKLPSFSRNQRTSLVPLLPMHSLSCVNLIESNMFWISMMMISTLLQKQKETRQLGNKKLPLW